MSDHEDFFDADSGILDAVHDTFTKEGESEFSSSLSSESGLRDRLNASEREKEELRSAVRRLELDVQRLSYAQEENTRLFQQMEQMKEEKQNEVESLNQRMIIELPLLRSSFAESFETLKEELSALKAFQRSSFETLNNEIQSLRSTINILAASTVRGLTTSSFSLSPAFLFMSIIIIIIVWSCDCVSSLTSPALWRPT